MPFYAPSNILLAVVRTRYKGGLWWIENQTTVGRNKNIPCFFFGVWDNESPVAIVSIRTGNIVTQQEMASRAGRVNLLGSFLATVSKPAESTCRQHPDTDHRHIAISSRVRVGVGIRVGWSPLGAKPKPTLQTTVLQYIIAVSIGGHGENYGECDTFVRIFYMTCNVEARSRGGANPLDFQKNIWSQMQATLKYWNFRRCLGPIFCSTWSRTLERCPLRSFFSLFTWYSPYYLRKDWFPVSFQGSYRTYEYVHTRYIIYLEIYQDYMVTTHTRHFVIRVQILLGTYSTALHKEIIQKRIAR